MILHVYGADAYRRSRAIRAIALQYQKKHPQGTVELFDCERQEAVAQLAMFGESAGGLFARAAFGIVLNPQEADKEVLAQLKRVAPLPAATLLVVSEKKLPKAFALLYGKEVGPAKKEFEPIEGAPLRAFLKADAAEKELRVADKDIQQVAELYAGDTWGAVTELERVASGGEVATAQTAFDFIGLIRTIAGAGLIARRLQALFLLLRYDEPAKVFNMVAAFAAGGQKSRLADYDLAIKGGRLEYAEALLEYVLVTSN